MFLETGQRKASDLGSMFGVPEKDHKRAAVNFVAELTGSPHAGCVKKASDQNDALVHADELPVPMFGVDLNLRCTFWNSRAAEITGWTESEVFAMSSFMTSLFNNRDCEEFLKTVLEGHETTHEIWSVNNKWEKEIKVVLSANARRDGMGDVCGAVCAIMPLSPPKVDQPALTLNCTVSAMDHMSILDLEEELPNGYGSPRGTEDLFLAALEQPPSPYFDGSVRDGMDMYCNQANASFESDDSSYSQEAEGSSICSQDWCKSEQSSESLRGAGNSLGGSSFTQARAMVVDPNVRGRKSLALMLERFGFEVFCASNSTEALYSYEQSMHDPEGFSVVFINLDSARGEDYALIRQLRSKETQCGGIDVSNQAILVAVTNFDRSQESMQKDMSAGLDAIIHYPCRVQQLRDTLQSLGVLIDHLNFANKSPRMSFNSWNNPLILAR